VRVISLVPSMTETLLAWGVIPVACTRSCEQPALRHVGGTKDPSLADIVALAPDLVIMDEEENRREDYDALRGCGVVVHSLRVRSVADVNDQLAPLAELLGASWAPVAAPALPIVRTAFVPIWRRPWMALGDPTYGSSLLAGLGIGNVFSGAGPYPTVTLESARALQPSLVIAPSEPYPFGPRHEVELSTVAPCVFVDGRDLLWWGARTAGALHRLGDTLG
jgi:ABC-type Fe3+-hydroxamate transport system substrate-binding protein